MSKLEPSATATAALLTDHDPRSVLDRLPNTVFPMRVKLQLSRARDTDTPTKPTPLPTTQ